MFSSQEAFYLLLRSSHRYSIFAGTICSSLGTPLDLGRQLQVSTLWTLSSPTSAFLFQVILAYQKILILTREWLYFLCISIWQEIISNPYLNSFLHTLGWAQWHIYPSLFFLSPEKPNLYCPLLYICIFHPIWYFH